MRLRFILLAAVVSVSSANAQCPTREATRAHWQERGRVGAFGHWLGGTRKELAQRFGTPTSVRADTVRWFSGPRPDSVFLWTYPRFSVSLAKSTQGGGEAAHSVTLSATLDAAPPVLAIGAVDSTFALRHLGNPASRDQLGDTAVLCFPLSDEGAEEQVYLSFVRGILVHVRWALYIG